MQAIKQTAVCMFTTFEEESLLTKCAALGACGHIYKPMTALKLRAVVHDVFPDAVLPAPDAAGNGSATPPPILGALEFENPDPASV